MSALSVTSSVLVIVGTFAVPVESDPALTLYMGAAMLLFAAGSFWWWFAVPQPESALLGLYICTAVLPAAFAVFAAIAMTRYDLTPAKLDALRAGRPA